MATMISRPTPPGGNKNDEKWRLWGQWGERFLPPCSTGDLRDLLHSELVRDGVLPSNAPRPSNKHHSHITDALIDSSWVNGRWVKGNRTS